MTFIGKFKSNIRILLIALHLIIMYGVCSISNFGDSRGNDKFESMHYLGIFNNLGLLLGAIIPMCIFERAFIFVPMSIIYQSFQAYGLFNRYYL